MGAGVGNATGTGAPSANETIGGNAANPTGTAANANDQNRDRDNTGVNARDRDEKAVTAGMQGQGKPDIDVTAEIRRRVTDTKMSVNAQNVKIITVNGKVTLRGPVKTQAEKDQVNAIATQVAGATNVDNQLEVEQSANTTNE